jgi:hypothetical protein
MGLVNYKKRQAMSPRASEWEEWEWREMRPDPGAKDRARALQTARVESLRRCDPSPFPDMIEWAAARGCG